MDLSDMGHDMIFNFYFVYP